MTLKHNDSAEERGFISKEKLLEYVSEEDIFQLVFSQIPEEFEYITSPFRSDKNPGCWFQRDIGTDKLRFVDFAHNKVVKGIKMINIDCFDAVQVYYGLNSFYETLEFIKRKLLKKEHLDKVPSLHVKKKADIVKKVKKPVEIMIQTRDFDYRDQKFWQPYGITKQQLIQDKVFPLAKFKMKNTKKGDFTNHCRGLAYAFTDFEQGRKKIYRPKKKGKQRFFTNCGANDIGGDIPPFGNKLLITKSYKDWRVVTNQGMYSVWFQNEGMFPSIVILKALIEGYKKVYIVFDNDQAGKEAAEKLVELINSYFPNKAKALFVPKTHSKVTDPSDLLYYSGMHHLNQFLNLIRHDI